MFSQASKTVRGRYDEVLHAIECRVQESQSVQGEVKPCSYPYCASSKKVLHHKTTCYEGKKCTYPHCTTYSDLFAHVNNCTLDNCPYCPSLPTIKDKIKGLGFSMEENDPFKDMVPVSVSQKDVKLFYLFGNSKEPVVGPGCIRKMEPFIKEVATPILVKKKVCKYHFRKRLARWQVQSSDKEVKSLF